MLGDVDLLAIGKSRLELLGQDSSGSKPANQLQPSLAQLVESPLIESDLRGDVAAAPPSVAKNFRRSIWLAMRPSDWGSFTQWIPRFHPPVCD